jgi:cyclopropane fatty-acyl-phospholipid synthase-like methyltransferase
MVGAVYAVEASSMAEQAQLVVDRNGLSDIVQIINAKMEDVNLPEQVDVIVSEVHAIITTLARLIPLSSL